jgi:hypothetical protein
MSRQRTIDVLVIGAGGAGMTAALAARARGLEVCVVEASKQVGGTTATSAGTLWLPGPNDTAARKYLRACIGTAASGRKITALLESGHELLRFLHGRTQVRLDAVAVHPDYLQSLPGASMGGRAYAPREFDGRRLGARFARVRAPLPEFMVLGGMMVSKADIPQLLAARRDPKAALHALKLVSRYALDRLWGHSRGTRLVMGNALVAQLFASTIEAGIATEFETTAAQVERLNAGFECVLQAPRAEVPLRVRKAIVLACGGYSGGAAMRRQWMPPAAGALSVAYPGNAGAGIALARSLGAAVESDHAQPAFWMPVSSMIRPDGSRAVFPHIVLDRAKPGSLAVDGSGRRFTNEADSYHHFCEAMLRECDSKPGQRFFLVADREFVRRYGIGMVRPGSGLDDFVRRGYLRRGGGPRALAAQLGLDAEAFSATLARYNALAASGSDEDFGRGRSALNRHNGDAAVAPNPCLRPLDTSELYAVELEVADLGTSIGLAADENARVLDAEGRAIAGLYACGNDMASMMRGAYPGPGTTLGPGMTFAWRAAQHIACGISAANCT